MVKLFFIFLISSQLLAQSEIYTIKSFKLENGEIINNCNIGFKTFGEMNADSSNVILFPTWFGGNSDHLATLIKKYEFIDTTQFFVIAVDALGNGYSTSPSNYEGELPLFTITDMVNSQYEFLANHFRFQNIHAIVGGSMGSFQAFEWAVAYPEFMNKIIPYVCSPALTSYEKLYFNLRIQMIEDGLKFGMPMDSLSFQLNLLTQLFARTPEWIIENIDADNFDSYLENFDRKMDETFTIQNHLAQVKAMLTHNISKHFDFDMDTATESIKAEILIIVSDTDKIVLPGNAKKLAKKTNSRLLILENNCGHLGVGCDMELVRNTINSFLQ